VAGFDLAVVAAGSVLEELITAAEHILRCGS
jgi:hypothetical protein